MAMEINPIEELMPGYVNEQVRMQNEAHRPCIYYKDEVCSVPKERFEMCGNCIRMVRFAK
jgi:hypothetical protein